MTGGTGPMDERPVAPPREAAADTRTKARFWLVLAGCFGLLIFRAWDRVTHPDLFAEGVRFVGYALNEGWPTLFQSYDMFFHTAPKLVALLAVNLVPVESIPLFTNLACLAVTAAAMATISRPAYRWIIPSDGARVILALLMVLAPGLVEILGNLAGLHWSLLLILALLCLKDPDQPLAAWELGLVALVALTSGGSVVFLAVASVRLAVAWRRRRTAKPEATASASGLRSESALFSILFLVAVYLMMNFISQEARVGHETDGLDIVAAARDIDDLLPHLGALFTTFYFLHPFLGTNNTSVFLVSVPFYPLVATAAAIVALLLWRLMRRMDLRFWVIPAWLGSMLGFAVMLSIVRYWSFYGIFSYPYDDWWFRYNFIFACTGLTFWVILLRVRDLSSPRSWSTGGMLILTVAYVIQAQAVTSRASPPHDTDSFAITRYEDTNYWSKTADELARSISTGCPARVKVAGSPGGKWTFVYESPLAGRACPPE